MLQRVLEHNIAGVIVMEALKADLAIVTIALAALQAISRPLQQLAAVRPISLRVYLPQNLLSGFISFSFLSLKCRKRFSSYLLRTVLMTSMVTWLGQSYSGHLIMKFPLLWFSLT